MFGLRLILGPAGGDGQDAPIATFPSIDFTIAGAAPHSPSSCVSVLRYTFQRAALVLPNPRSFDPPFPRISKSLDLGLVKFDMGCLLRSSF